MHAGVIPPTTFGVVFVVQSVRPGSTRSGANARWKSSPVLRPLVSRIGWSTSRVVPGHVVDSSTTSWPLRSTFARSRAALSTIERSGSRWRESGVGTAMTIASQSGDLGVVGRRAELPAGDERRETLRGDVLDVALAAVQPLDEVGDDIDDEDGRTGLGECHRMRDTDVSRADNGNIVSLAHPAARLATTRSAA